MRNPLTAAALICILSFSTHTFAQRRKPALVCKQTALAALKPMPELSYPCDGLPNEWDEKNLKLPERVAAIKSLTSQLSSFSDPAWWATDAVDLSVCDFTQKPGPLTPEQRRNFLQGEYLFWLFGNDRIRLMLIPDPCYQTEYGGANAFLLYRHDGHVTVTQVLDGYFSRADNSVNVAFAKFNAEEIIEIATWSGGLNPSVTNYYFVIDPRTSEAVPKNLFKGPHGPTNEISSALLMNTNATPLNIVRGKSLAPSFTIYVDDLKGKIDDNGRTLSRKILRWNGKMYRQV
ncbi:MAG TPA: hypothetical protein VN644_02545 [Pyrinomonadaceae bacterium]|nr:hypothetical protein [Pyrinomonadaceae bacterium]